MKTIRLKDDEWKKIQIFLRSYRPVKVGSARQCRQFVEAVLWMSRSGAPWRLLPDEYGKWNSVYKRFARWCEVGVWEAMLQHFASDPDMENVMIDSTTVRAHPSAAGAQKTGGQAAQALGRSWGGFSSKIHVTVDGLGYPLRVRLTAGQVHDSQQAQALLEGLIGAHIVADRGYAGQPLEDWITQQGAIVVIPPHQNARQPREYDRWLYRERHLIECFINKIKHFRRVFSRFDKLATRYLGFVHFVSALIWLR